MEEEELSPFRGRSSSAPPNLCAARRYGRELRRMSDEFQGSFKVSAGPQSMSGTVVPGPLLSVGPDPESQGLPVSVVHTVRQNVKGPEFPRSSRRGARWHLCSRAVPFRYPGSLASTTSEFLSSWTAVPASRGWVSGSSGVLAFSPRAPGTVCLGPNQSRS